MEPEEAIALGRGARRNRDFTSARAHYLEAAKGYRARDEMLAYAHAIRHVGDIYMEESNIAAAQPLYEEALGIYRGSLHTKILDLANTLRPYAILQEARGNTALATSLWREARHLYAALHIEAGVAECDAHLRSA